MKHLWMALLFVCSVMTTSSLPADTLKWVVAFAQDDMSNDFRRAQVLEARDAASLYPNVRFVYSDARGQTSQLLRDIEQFIQQKVDALILGTNDENAVVPLLKRVREAGIRLIIVDRGVNSSDFDTFIDSDNVAVGEIAGREVAKQLAGNGLVLLLEGLQTADVTRHRTEGFMKAVEAHPGIQVIKRTGNYLRKDSVLEVEKLLAQKIQPDAIFSESDSMLSGARMVLERNGIDPASLVTVGVDYITEARDAIMTGKQSASVRFPLNGKAALEAAIRLLSGESLPDHIQIPVELVTRDNAEKTLPVF